MSDGTLTTFHRNVIAVRSDSRSGCEKESHRGRASVKP